MRASDLPPVCLGYGRKSIARHASDLISVDRQRDAIERLAAERGERLIWFEDAEGHRSGRFERTRPDFLRLMRHIESEPGVRSVVVYRIDRAGRSVVLIDKLIKLCQAKDIAFVSIVDGIDSSRGMNAGEIFRVQALAMVAEYQANRAADDMRDAVAKFKQSGISWGYTPFGLTRSGRGYDARLVPNPDAPTVEALLTYYTTSPSYSDTAEVMNQRGYQFRTRHGTRKPFGVETVRTLVGNVLIYAGYVVQGKWRAKKARVTLDGSGTRLEQYAACVNATRSTSVEPIISPELASAVIERRFSAQRARRRSDTWIPLLTPLAHANGVQLRADRGKFGLHEYWYRARRAGAWIPAERAEAQVLGVLTGLQFPPELRDAVRDELGRIVGDDARAAAQQAIAAAQRRMGVLQEMRLDGSISRDAYNAQYAVIEAEIRRHEETLAAPTHVDALMDALADLGGTIQMMTRANQRRAVHHLFERVDFDGDGRLVALHARPWARQTFQQLARAVEAATRPKVPPTGVANSDGLVWRVLALIVTRAERARSM